MGSVDVYIWQIDALQRKSSSSSSSSQTLLGLIENHRPLQPNKHPLNMLFATSALLLSAVASLTVATPLPGNHKPSYNMDKYNKDCKDDWEQKWKNDAWKKDEKIFYFDAEYYVKATPDQVINNSNVSAPGQPGAKGLFKYGINVAENTICYVSPRICSSPSP
jgi:hypothetical protein